MSSRELYSEINLIDSFEIYFCQTVKVTRPGCTFQFSTDKDTQIGCLFPRSVRIGEGLPDLGSFQPISNVKDYLVSLSATHKISASMRREDVPLLCQCFNGNAACCYWIAESLSIEKKKSLEIGESKTEGVRTRVRKIDWDATAALLEIIEPSRLEHNVVFVNLERLTINGLAFQKGSNSSVFFNQEVICDIQKLPTNDFKPTKLGFQFDFFALNGRICEQVPSSHNPAASKVVIKTKDAPNTFIGTIDFIVQTKELGSGGCIKIFNPKFGPGHETKVWFSGRNVYRQGKSLENTNLSGELLAGDSVMVYFERLKAPSLKIQAMFKIPFEAILVTIGEPNCGDPIFQSITQGNVKLDSAARRADIPYKIKKNGDPLLPIPVNFSTHDSKLQTQNHEYPVLLESSYQIETDEERLLKRLSAKLTGQSSKINVVEDEISLSAGLRIMSTLSDELMKYCLSKERKRIGEIFLKHKSSMGSVSQLLKVLSSSIEGSATSYDKPSESLKVDHSNEILLRQEKDKKLREDMRKYEMPSSSKGYHGYEKQPHEYEKRVSTSADDIYSKGLDVEKYLINLDKRKDESRSSEPLGYGPTDRLAYSREDASSGRLYSKVDAYSESSTRYRSGQRESTFDERGYDFPSYRRSPTSSRRYILSPPRSYDIEGSSDELRKSMETKRLKYDLPTYDYARQRQSSNNWEGGDVPRPLRDYPQRFS